MALQPPAHGLGTAREAVGSGSTEAEGLEAPGLLPQDSCQTSAAGGGWLQPGSGGKTTEEGGSCKGQPAQHVCHLGWGGPDPAGWSRTLPSDGLARAPDTLSSPVLPLARHSMAGTLGDMPRVPQKLSGRDGVHRLRLINSSPVPHLRRGRFGARTQGEGTWKNRFLIFILVLGKHSLGVARPFPARGGDRGHVEGTQLLCATPTRATLFLLASKSLWEGLCFPLVGKPPKPHAGN